MRKRSYVIFICCLLWHATDARANSPGFGITGGYGFNLFGFKGTRDGKVSSSALSDNFLAGGYLEYNLGPEEKKEHLSIALEINFIRRHIEASFDAGASDKAPRYYKKVFKSFTLDCLDVVVNFFWQAAKFDHGVFGPYIGAGGYYMLGGGHSSRFLNPTEVQRQEVDNNLSKYNILAAAGIKNKFLDHLMSWSLGITYTFMEQYSPKNTQSNPLKDEYGSDLSIGKGQLGIVAKLNVDIWQMIVG